jgi:hypothetical protein
MIDRETSLLALRAENRERITRQCANRRPIREDGWLLVLPTTKVDGRLV